MLSKPKIIFVGDYSREDYVKLLEASKDYCEFYFLYYTSPNEEKSNFYKSYGYAIYWKNFTSAQQLLQKICPSKVVFLYIESYNHVVLNLACKSFNIPTYQLEHGLRADYVVGFDPKFSPSLPVPYIQRLKSKARLLLQISSKIKSRLFLLNSIKLLPKEAADFAREFILVRKKHNFLETSRRVASYKRIPQIYISFSHNIFKIHQKEENLPINTKVHFIGVPYFDHLAKIKEAEEIKAVLFIDQPLAEQSLLGWTKELKHSFSKQLVTICNALGYTLLVKLHPVQDKAGWAALSQNHDLKLISDSDIDWYAPRVRIVFGFYSTYLLPFAALKHITLLTYEKHPVGKLMVSKPFTDAGVAYPIFNLEDLYNVLSGSCKIHRDQLSFKAKFTEDWLYRFDGNSGARLRDILLSQDN
ncbi:polysialyltransferase family glycosyltransferase [uncultured Pontibacter sp.]|uniref:polysialyltransferase family glycosyltransferase n=1 Tax=uncultured Pontibacter sp. TaxID=453356 RepID=UPI00262197E3|nr:polysialyltransferase family glycosyltransferase [uncultured Pontibacter sp.]